MYRYWALEVTKSQEKDVMYKKMLSKVMLKFVAAIGVCAVTLATVQAAGVPFAQIVSHPLTPSGIKAAGLSASTQKSSGLLSTGLGTPVYLEVQVTNIVVTQVVWRLQIPTNDSRPSLAVLQDSPLNNLLRAPIYDVGERNTYFVPTNQYAGASIVYSYTYTNSPGGNKTNSVTVALTNVTTGGSVTYSNILGGATTNTTTVTVTNNVYLLQGRTALSPDVVGEYIVAANVYGKTGAVSVLVSVTNKITAAEYIGVEDSGCAFCHSGKPFTTNDNYGAWFVTYHADAFERKIDGGPAFDGTLLGAGFKSSCYSCHTTGYDANSNALNNGGFYDEMTNAALLPPNSVNYWIPPTSGPGQWENMPVALQDKANIQCEDCHGPAGEHFGDTNKISISLSAGVCASCHDSTNGHVTAFEWSQSMHGSGSASYKTNNVSANPLTFTWCSRCHSTAGFIDAFKTNGITRTTGLEGITCAACHDPHPTGTETNEHLLRTLADIKIGPENGPVVATISDGGDGKLCMQCHRSRFVSAAVNTSNYPASFGPHDSPIADMLAGVNGIEYGGFTNLSLRSPHLTILKDTCINCHMEQSIKTSTNPSISNSFMYAQGHTMKMVTTDGVDIAVACQSCHVETGGTNFDFVDTTFNPLTDNPNNDYDGDAVHGVVVEGVQTQVSNLLSRLAALLPPFSHGSIGVNANSSVEQLKAAYNYDFVSADGSHGVHNAGYAVDLLKASIADMQDWGQYSPRTNTTLKLPVFTWPAADGTLKSGVTNYTLQILLNGKAFKTLALKGAPTWTPAAPLAAGNYQWRVGTSRWISFSRLAVAPGPITLISPSGISTGGTTRVFTWVADLNSTKYNMEIHTPNGKTSTFAGITGTSVAKTIAKGTNTWQMQGINTDGLGTGPWSTNVTYIIR